MALTGIFHNKLQLEPKQISEMTLVVVSHKLCWPADDYESQFATDGGFPIQMSALSSLFRETKILVPCALEKAVPGITPLTGNNLIIVPLSILQFRGLQRKIALFGWLFRNGATIWREIRKADAVHTPIPGEIGTIGMLFALIQKKPLFVRHCGNWFEQRTLAEHFWKWSMESFAGGQNVMFATGGAIDPPSKKNKNIEWIFSTSLSSNQLNGAMAKTLPPNGPRKLITVCRQEPRKGTEIVIKALHLLFEIMPDLTLDIVGDGSLLPELRQAVGEMGLNEKVQFLGKVPQSSVTALMRNADIFCYPTSASEGFPKVVLEALAAGLPVISTNVSVIPQLIDRGCGILLAQPSAELLANAIKEAIDDEEKYARMSSCAIKTARSFTLEAWSEVIGLALTRAWVTDHETTPVGSQRPSREYLSS